MYSGFRLTNELAEITRAEVEKQKQEIFQIQNQAQDSDSDDDIEIISSNVSDEVYNDTRLNCVWLKNKTIMPHCAK